MSLYISDSRMLKLTSMDLATYLKSWNDGKIILATKTRSPDHWRVSTNNF